MAPIQTRRTRAHSGSRDADIAALVCAAREGEQAAWTSLVNRFDAMMRMIARSHGLPACDVDDVVQATWLAVLEDIADLREPAAISGWLATAVRRAAQRVARRPTREQPTDDPELGDRADSDEPARRVVEAERREIVARALATLPDRQRRLMLLLGDSDLDYRQIGHILAMSPGSIGPTRGRCLERLRRHPELQALRGSTAVPPSGGPRIRQSAVLKQLARR